MDLILWRHAEAEDAEGGMTDLERRLTKQGRKQAKRVADWLLQHLPAQRRILVSPAVRTCQTADALGAAYEIEPTISPGATAKAILIAANWPKADGTVLVVGHQPCLGEVASLLLAGQEGGFSVRKGAAWWVTGRRRGGAVEAVIRAVADPELL